MSRPDPALAARVARAGPALVQRAKDGVPAEPVVPPVRLVAALGLGPGPHGERWVAVVEDAVGARWTVPLVEGEGEVRRAVAGDGVAAGLVALLATGGVVAQGFELRRWHAEPVTGERAVAVDQTNESVVVGERAVVKWSLHLPTAAAPARHPAPDRLAALAAAGFDGTPRPWGVLSRSDDDGTAVLAVVTGYLPGAQDGWDWMVDDVRALARGELDADGALAPVVTLGRLTAGLHAAFAATGREALSAVDAHAWAEQARAELAEAVRAVDGPEGALLTARAPRVAAGLEVLAGCAGTPLVDVHGDLHVGQVLRHGDPPRYAVVDFDGNPVLAAPERARRRPAAVDVAGMMASLDHVGRVVIRRTPGVDVAVVTRWIRAAEAAYLDAYRSALAAHGLADLLDERLLRPVRLQQECREFLYAVRHLPHWRYVPDAALGALLDPAGGD